MVVKGCDPNDPTDNRIFFEMTGRRIGEDDFPQSDETDEEYDEIVKLREIFGYIDIEN